MKRGLRCHWNQLSGFGWKEVGMLLLVTEEYWMQSPSLEGSLACSGCEEQLSHLSWERPFLQASRSEWRKQDYTDIHKPQSRWFLASFVQRWLHIKTLLRIALLHGYCKFWSHPDHPKRLVCLHNALLFFFCNPMKFYSLTGFIESLIAP